VNPYTRVARATIRLVAFALVLISLLLYAVDRLYLIHGMMDTVGPSPAIVRPPLRPGRLVFEAILLLLGVILFWKSRALAEHFTKDLE
jgi:hypothetical protein